MWSFNVSVPRSIVVPVAALCVALVPTAASAASIDFAPPVESAIDNGAGPGPAPRANVSADVDGDGSPDIVSIGNLGFGGLLVSISNGDGTFAAATSIPGTSGSQGVDVGDVDGDGIADVVTATVAQLQVLLGNGDGTFTSAGTYPYSLGGQVQPILTDVDNDGDLDVVSPSFTSINTLLNDGSGTFADGPTSWVAGAGVVSAIAPARLDSDGLGDLFAVDGLSGTTFALVGTGGGRYTVTGRLLGSGFIPEDVVAIDLDGDGFDDAATVGSFSFTLATGLTNGIGRFRSVFPATVRFAGPGPTSAAAADLDGDGREDLVVSSLANPLQGTLTVLAGNGTARPTKVGAFATASFPQNPMLIDADGDGRTDMVTVSPGTITTVRNVTP
ncbi:FG-GAP repeat protein [Aeromicrobium marinum DSM 15272]|uniref:FG-GAP repeat protein n=1 Tax=Aeromicrobium marinum DSM 15272 TaxID=585531 RepID=E2SD95_9ACTN|nr:VCBS repeat-containing protein [Aeromicrobium marinum]EFQ82472.1 FG-GAP repeat protein [Aeromicrobium marinum DSM 15272]